MPNNSQKEIQNAILKLKEQQNAILLVHNYQRPEIQDIADFLGDSLGLAKQAAQTDADIIVFCGVEFMAETAKILSPEKMVLLPERDADCPMANMVSDEEILEMQKKHPDAKVVSYVNTTASVKAVSDVCCTSSNAVQVVKNIDADKIIFTPDKNLGFWVKRFVDKEMILWDGFCYVHHRITPEDIKKSKQKMPEASVIVHPECRPEVADLADRVESTGGMVKFARETEAKKIIVGTESGILHRLKKESPDKEFYTAGPPRICQNMKKITLESVLKALQKVQYKIEVPEKIAKPAKITLDKMLNFS
ncbi:MAG: quinolinate synthase NadA [Candidatus Marinimicrobia bacterium]|nr:quinolinate synthase NadA [Candidatus Neomarinimicrobiota bacterium]